MVVDYLRPSAMSRLFRDPAPVYFTVRNPVIESIWPLMAVNTQSRRHITALRLECRRSLSALIMSYSP
jgi:hypothetical protein